MQNPIKSKQISVSTKKSTVNSQKGILTKKPTIVKCFICNQMFYCQQTFDIHMNQHQKKVNKNLPQQIQRKTLQSFGVKRKQSLNRNNTTLQAINQNQLSQKTSLSSTMKNPPLRNQLMQSRISTKLKQTSSFIVKKPFSKIVQPRLSKQQTKLQNKDLLKQKKQVQDKQIQQIDEAIKQSTFLMNQITFLTQQIDYNDNLNQYPQNQSEQQQQQNLIQKTGSQIQFIKMVRQENCKINKIQQQIIKVNFNNKSLENCQVQIQFLRKIYKLSNDIKSLQKINKIKSKILLQVINLIIENNMNAQKNLKNITKSQRKIQIKQFVNQSAINCSQCLDSIRYGQNAVSEQTQYYHELCYKELIQQTH